MLKLIANKQLILLL